ncbi:MAG: hypothetical protein N3A69_02720 [Leptospiraceae bacterium]|nr:hypothetical protein [Leptospiraceae bacterium]
MSSVPFIEESFHVKRVSPESFDHLMSFGYRRVRNTFYRYSLGEYQSEIVTVVPLRIQLANYFPSESQRKTLRKNRDLEVTFKPLEITPEITELFAQHTKRFKENIPEFIEIFVAEYQNPCETLQCEIRDSKKLVAVSFLDVGKFSTSSIYAMFDLEYSKRRLGIYTMLLEIQYSIENGKKYYYPGYAYDKSSFYDYKKTFHGMEYLDWREKKWLPFPRLTTL